MANPHPVLGSKGIAASVEVAAVPSSRTVLCPFCGPRTGRLESKPGDPCSSCMKAFGMKPLPRNRRPGDTPNFETIEETMPTEPRIQKRTLHEKPDGYDEPPLAEPAPSPAAEAKPAKKRGRPAKVPPLVGRKRPEAERAPRDPFARAGEILAERETGEGSTKTGEEYSQNIPAAADPPAAEVGGDRAEQPLPSVADVRGILKDASTVRSRDEIFASPADLPPEAAADLAFSEAVHGLAAAPYVPETAEEESAPYRGADRVQWLGVPAPIRLSTRDGKRFRLEIRADVELDAYAAFRAAEVIGGLLQGSQTSA